MKDKKQKNLQLYYFKTDDGFFYACAVNIEEAIKKLRETYKGPIHLIKDDSANVEKRTSNEEVLESLKKRNEKMEKVISTCRSIKECYESDCDTIAKSVSFNFLDKRHPFNYSQFHFGVELSPNYLGELWKDIMEAVLPVLERHEKDTSKMQKKLQERMNLIK